MKKRILSLLLAALMIFSLLPTMALAGTTQNCQGGDDCTHKAAIGTTHYDTLANAATAAVEGDTIEIIKAGTYAFSELYALDDKAVTVKSTLSDRNSVVLTRDVNINGNGNRATYENLTVQFAAKESVNGISHNPNGGATTADVKFNNCVISGFLYGYDKMTFTECKFVLGANESKLNMTTYGANVTYTKCTFDGSVNVYWDSITADRKIVFDTCTFNKADIVNDANAAVFVKAAGFEAKSKKLEVEFIGEQTLNGYENATYMNNDEIKWNGLRYISADGLWQVDDLENAYATVKVKGESVFPFANLTSGNFILRDSDIAEITTGLIADGYKAVKGDVAGYLHNNTPYYLYTVTALPKVAQIGDKTYTTLADAVNAATDGQVIELLDDVTLTARVEIGKKITLDLGGKTVTPADGFTTTKDKRFGLLTVDGGNLTVKNGTIDSNNIGNAVIGVVGAAEDKDSVYSKLTIESNAKIVDAENKGWGIYLLNSNYGGDGSAYDAQIDIKGEVDGCVFVVGTVHGGDSVINISGKVDKGVYLNGHATVNVEEGAIINSTTYWGNGSGIEVRAGNLNVKGGTISSSGDPATVDPNNSGSTTVGCAVAVSQHTTKLPINVNITGGELKGVYAFREVNPQENANTDLDKITLSITDGEFYGNVESVYTKNFISGGTFSSKPNFDYLAEGYYAKEITEGTEWQVKPMEVVVKPAVVGEGSKITVGEENVEVKDENGESITDNSKATAVAQAITNTLATEAVYAFENTKIEDATEDLKITDLKDVTEGTTIKDKQVNVKLKSVKVEENNTAFTITRMEFDVKPVAVLNNGTEKDIPNNKIKAPITFRLPVDFTVTATTVAVYHKGDGETEFKLMGTYPIQTVGTGSSTDQFIEVKSKEFSTFAYELLNANNATAEIDGDYYATLANAIEKAGGKTITVLKNTNEVVTVERAMNFKLEVAEGKNFTGAIRPGDDYVRHIYGDKYYFELYEAGDTIVIGGNRNKDAKADTAKEENPETGAPVLSMSTGIVLAGIALVLAKRK